MSEYFFNPWAIPYFSSFFISFIITIVLFNKKRKDKQIQLFIMAYFFFTVLSLAAAMATSSLHPDVWLFWFYINVITSIISVTILFHFSQVYLVGGKPIAHKKIFLIYLVPLFFVSWALIDALFWSSEVISSDRSPFGLYLWKEGFLLPFIWPVFYFCLGLMMTLSFYNFVRMFKQQENTELRRRSSYFIITTLITLITMSIMIVALFLLRISLKVELSIVFLSAEGTIFTYGILKDKLFDISIYVKKSISYAIITVAITWIFLLSEEALNAFIAHSFFYGIPLADLISGVFVVLLFLPLKDFSHKITDKLFPDTKQISTTHMGIKIYKKLLKLAWKDGNITEKASAMLKELRSFFRIADEEHARLEREFIEDR